MLLNNIIRCTIAYLAINYAKGFGYEAIEIAARESGAVINMGSVRTQIMSYVNKGLMERIRPGRFRVTEAGRKASGVPAPEDETPDDDSSSVSNVNIADEGGTSSDIQSRDAAETSIFD